MGGFTTTQHIRPVSDSVARIWPRQLKQPISRQKRRYRFKPVDGTGGSRRRAFIGRKNRSRFASVSSTAKGCDAASRIRLII